MSNPNPTPPVFDYARLERAVQELAVMALPGPNGELPVIFNLDVERSCSGQPIKVTLLVDGDDSPWM